MSMTTVSVSQYVKKKLDEIKDRNGHTSMDSVIRTLLLKDLGVKVKCHATECVHNIKGYCTKSKIEIGAFGAVICKQYRASHVGVMDMKTGKLSKHVPEMEEVK